MLFESNGIAGLLDMDLLMIVDYLAMGLLFLALYAALSKANPSLAAIGLVLELVALATYFASTTAFEMLSLSESYASAVTDAERAMYLAAGQAMLVTWQGTSFDVSYVLSALAALIISAVMLRRGVFGRTTAYAGLVTGVATLVPPTVGPVGLALSLLSLLSLGVCLILIARTLFQLTTERVIATGA